MEKSQPIIKTKVIVAYQCIVSYDERKSVLSDHEGYHCVFWVLFFTVMLLSLNSGTALLLLNYII